jgi:hypothetical protein
MIQEEFEKACFELYQDGPDYISIKLSKDNGVLECLYSYKYKGLINDEVVIQFSEAFKNKEEINYCVVSQVVEYYYDENLIEY